MSGGTELAPWESFPIWGNSHYVVLVAVSAQKHVIQAQFNECFATSVLTEEPEAGWGLSFAGAVVMCGPDPAALSVL